METLEVIESRTLTLEELESKLKEIRKNSKRASSVEQEITKQSDFTNAKIYKDFSYKTFIGGDKTEYKLESGTLIVDELYKDNDSYEIYYENIAHLLGINKEILRKNNEVNKILNRIIPKQNGISFSDLEKEEQLLVLFTCRENIFKYEKENNINLLLYPKIRTKSHLVGEASNPLKTLTEVQTSKGKDLPKNYAYKEPIGTNESSALDFMLGNVSNPKIIFENTHTREKNADRYYAKSLQDNGKEQITSPRRLVGKNPIESSSCFDEEKNGYLPVIGRHISNMSEKEILDLAQTKLTLVKLLTR